MALGQPSLSLSLGPLFEGMAKDTALFLSHWSSLVQDSQTLGLHPGLQTQQLTYKPNVLEALVVCKQNCSRNNLSMAVYRRWRKRSIYMSPQPTEELLVLATEKHKLSRCKAAVSVTDTYLSCLEGFSRTSR